MSTSRAHGAAHPFPRLLAPGRLGTIDVSNRLVLAPMDDNMAGRGGHVTEQKVAWYRRKAEGGVGTVLTGNAYVTPRGRGLSFFQMGIDDDDKLPGLRRLATEVGAAGARVGVQLAHAGRQTTSDYTGGFPPEAPSPLPEPFFGAMPEELTVKRIDALVRAFADAANRARAAGFDLVEIHGGHGMLQHAFLSPLLNVRGDEYGGSLEARARFGLECVAAVRRAVGRDFTVGYRFSCGDLHEGGLTVEDALRLVPWLEKAGVDYLHVSAGIGGSYAAARMILAPPGVGPGQLEPYARRVKAVASVPVLTVGRYNSPELAERVIADGSADFVVMGRALIADPDLPLKAAAGRSADIRPCVACQQGCIDRWVASLDVTCAVNPEAGRELEPVPVPDRLCRVVVVGGGPAGLEAACVAARHGHSVTLLEREERLGGQLVLVARVPFQAEWGEFVDWLRRQATEAGVDVRTGVEATPALVLGESPDVVVVATGARAAPSTHVPGWELPNAVDALAVLAGDVESGPRVAVVGASLVACRTALFLADRGHEVTLLAAEPGPAQLAVDGAGPIIRPMIEEWLVEQATLLFGRVPKRVTAEGLVHDAVGVVAPHLSETRVGPLDEQFLAVDTVILSAGRRACDELFHALAATGEVAQLLLVGDATGPATVQRATSDGLRAARRIGIAHPLAATHP